MLHGADPLLSLAVVLVAGIACGQLAARIHLPAVTGQILAGILLGPSVLDVFEAEAIRDLQPMTHFALGLIGVTVGSHLNLRRLFNARLRLALLLLLECTVTPLLVLACVRGLGASWTLAVLLAALSISTAPATVLALVKETRSRGVLVKTLVAGVALNNIACIGSFELAYSIARSGLLAEEGHWLDPLLAPLRLFALSATLGGAAGILLVRATRRIVRPDRLATYSVIAILLTAGLADWVGVSALLACMFLGIALANLTPEKEELGHGVFADFEAAIFAVFFTLAGLDLHLDAVVAGGVLALAMFAARITGKILAAGTAMKLAGATRGVRQNLGLALLPQAGVAVGLLLLVQEDPVFAGVSDLLIAIGLSVVTLNEIVGPVLTRVALRRSGDFGQDRARLIDFLHEENIVTDFHARDKEDAIRRLVDHLVRSNHLEVDREALLASVLEREAQVSTCIGGGLAIPHGVLPDGDRMVGAMGVSREGLAFDTPDGRPVHCMVVLATPAEQRERHLEVLGALAGAIGLDDNIQRQLFNAKSPAHVYDILHAKEHEGFNYFLED